MLMQVLVITALLVPLLSLSSMILGYLHDRKRKLCVPDEMIIQITTIGNAKTVNEIISQIRAYGLEISYTVWIVTEPFVNTGEYVGADRILVVPRSFTPRSLYKGRAQEYSRRIRRDEGLGHSGVKILFLDDDTIPTKRYIEAAFFADYDISQGIITPTTGYGRLLSHLDDGRILNCLISCSVSQGFGRPLWAHGEGLCVRGNAEQIVTWDYPIFASEDLVFVHMAKDKGLQIGFFHEHIHITSPWTIRAFLMQRRRWTWGNIEALSIVPLKSSIRIIGTQVIVGTLFPIAMVSVPLILLGIINTSWQMKTLTLVVLMVWHAMFAYVGWINSKGKIHQALIASMLAWITAATNLLAMILNLVQGNPHRFEVIEKEIPMHQKGVQ